MRPFQRFTRNARVAVMLASEEARELSDRETGSQHLLLGILQAAGDDLTNVLQRLRIDRRHRASAAG